MTRSHRSTFGITLALMALFAAACDTRDETDQTASAAPQGTAVVTASAVASTSPSATTQDEGGEETSVFDLEIGDCFTATGDEVETVTVVDCEETHIYEVFAVFDHEAGPDVAYPGDDEILEYADAECQPLFEDYVAIDYESSDYWITSVTPSQQTWEEGGDREIVCALKLGEEGEETTGSAEGSGE